MNTLTLDHLRSNRLVVFTLRSLFIAALLLPVGVVGIMSTYQIWHSGRVFPGVSLGGLDLGGMRPATAAVQLSQVLDYPQRGRIILRDGERSWLATPAELGFQVDYTATALSALQVGRRGSLWQNLNDQFNAYQFGTSLSPVMIYDEGAAQRYLQILAKAVDHPVIEANLGLNGAEVIVRSGEIGRTLDIPSALTQVGSLLQSQQDGVIDLPVNETPPMILDASAQAESARRILSAPLVLSLPGGQNDAGPWTFELDALAQMLTIERVAGEGSATYQVVLNSQSLRAFLTGLTPSLERYPANARYIFNDDTHLLEVIQPAVIGRGLDVEASIQAINQQLLQGEHNIPLTVTLAPPPASDTTTGEQLGITELVHAETSFFYGSSAARVHNIATAAARFHGLLLAPGETFSMAQALGDVTLDNGYEEALIIWGDQTIKGVGGGVCQVSTTLFRTVFFAGFPVNERYPHAYRVSYYEQRPNGSSDPDLAGLDATVFVPLVDFKFTNDTPYWLLMETYINGYSLTWKFYSTSDGRTVVMNTSGPTNTIKPPDPLYTENPELAKDVIKQVDWAAEGADISISRIVYRDGSVYFTDSFFTRYEPWQAKYEYGPGTEGIPTPEPD